MSVDISNAEYVILGTNEPVPDGCVCFGQKWPSNTEHSRDRERLKRAIADGKLGDVYRRVRSNGDTNGPVYVNEARALAYLRDYDESRSRAGSQKKGKAGCNVDALQVEDAITALCEINNGITLMQATLERLTVAVESIATQPKTPQQELMHTFSTNGFDS